MCEKLHKGCSPIARKLCAETGSCPLGGAASDGSVVRLPYNQRLVGATPKDLSKDWWFRWNNRNLKRSKKILPPTT